MATASGKTHCTPSETPGNQGETDGGSWCAICDSVLELSLEVMIRNQSKQDNQYFLLMHVKSRLSKSSGLLRSPGSSSVAKGEFTGPPSSGLYYVHTEVGRPKEACTGHLTASARHCTVLSKH